MSGRERGSPLSVVPCGRVFFLIQSWFRWLVLPTEHSGWILIEFDRFSLGSTGFDRVLLGFTGFYRVLTFFSTSFLSFFWCAESSSVVRSNEDYEGNCLINKYRTCFFFAMNFGLVLLVCLFICFFFQTCSGAHLETNFFHRQQRRR